MVEPVLLTALKEIRRLNPKCQVFLMLDYEGDRQVAIYEARIEHRKGVSRMRFRVKDGDNFNAIDIVNTFMDKLISNMKRTTQ